MNGNEASWTRAFPSALGNEGNSSVAKDSGGYQYLQYSLGAGDAFDAWITAHGLLDGAGEALKDGFDEMMRFVGIENFDVKGESGFLGESAEKLNGKLRGKIAGLELVQVEAFRGTPDEERATAEIERNADEGFIHGKMKIAVADEALLVAERLDQGLAENDSSVLDGVVEIDVNITLGLHIEIEERVLGEKSEHVVEERNSRGYLRVSAAIDGEFDLDVGLAGDAMNLRCTCLAHEIISFPDRSG